MIKQFSKVVIVIAVTIGLSGCWHQPRPGDPRFAPAIPDYQIPRKPIDGAILKVGYEPFLYVDQKARNVGDLITIVFDEAMTANKKAKSSLKKDSKNDMTNTTLFGTSLDYDVLKILPFSTNKDLNLNFTTDNKRSFSGDTSSDQSNTLTGRMTVTVTQVMPNGNLVVRGEKWLKLNQGDEYVRLTGIIRPRDVNANNEVTSSRIADARISYSGVGMLADSNKAGWMYRALSSFFWPF